VADPTWNEWAFWLKDPESVRNLAFTVGSIAAIVGGTVGIVLATIPDMVVLFVGVLIQGFREANPDKVDQELRAAEFFREKMPIAFAGSARFWKWLAWLSKMPNRLSVGDLRGTW
jgi:hypothetical protein